MKPNCLLTIAACASLAVVSSAMIWIGDQSGAEHSVAGPEEIPPTAESAAGAGKAVSPTTSSERTVNDGAIPLRFPPEQRDPPPASAASPKAISSSASAPRLQGGAREEAAEIPPHWIIVDPPANGAVQAISANASAVSAPRSPAPIPQAFRDPSPAAAENPQIKASLEELQQNFVDAIGGPNQDPADPEYLKRWIAAQRQLDVQYRLLVGTQQFLLDQMQTNNQAD